jgi:hypothetical protein
MKKLTAITVCLLAGTMVLETTPAWALTAEQEAKLLPSDGVDDDLFGVSVALDGEGALVGALWDDANGSNTGSAYVFRVYDDDVPATSLVGLAVLLVAVLGSGVYFTRRRVS